MRERIAGSRLRATGGDARLAAACGCAATAQFAPGVLATSGCARGAQHVPTRSAGVRATAQDGAGVTDRATNWRISRVPLATATVFRVLEDCP